MQEFVTALFGKLGFCRAYGDERLRFGSEREMVFGLDIVKRLYAERVARENQSTVDRIVDRNRVHAAKRVGEGQAVAPVQVQRRFAIRLRGLRNIT